jgi:hypothetical protein
MPKNTRPTPLFKLPQPVHFTSYSATSAIWRLTKNANKTPETTHGNTKFGKTTLENIRQPGKIVKISLIRQRQAVSLLNYVER